MTITPIAPPLGAGGISPFVPPVLTTEQSAAPSAFAQKLDELSSLTTQADVLATGVATGELQDVHQFTAAAAKAQLGVELTVALRNKAVEAYQEIMRMQV